MTTNLPPRPTYAEISLPAIKHNLRRLREISQMELLIAVKANGYGHGAFEVARAAREVGVDWFGVAFTEEGIALRRAGLEGNILVLGYTPPHLVAAALEHALDLTVYEADIAGEYAALARTAGKPLRVHIKVDSGMGRLGQFPEDAFSLVQQIQTMEGIQPVGIFTHFANSDCADLSYAREQTRRFQTVIDALKAAGICPPLVHAANSAAALYLPEARFSLARVGIAAYGLQPSADAPLPADFLPALNFKSTVSQVKTFPPNTSISYGRIYYTRDTEHIAVIPVGYGDGYRRSPAKNAPVLIQGIRAPIVGRICMDQFMVNVSHIPQVKVGDEVVLVGRQGDEQITAEEVAGCWNTINYEVTTCLMPRVPRLFV